MWPLQLVVAASVGVVAGTPSCLPNDNGTTSAAGFVRSSVTLEVANWDTHKLITHAVRVLLEERLGLSVRLFPHPGGPSLYERVARGTVDANVEVWPAGKEEGYRRWVCKAEPCSVREQRAISRDLGFSGDTGMFVAYRSPAILTRHLLDHWRAYHSADNAKLLPPADFSTRGSRDHCAERFCSSDGRFYPGRCGGEGHGTGSRGNMTAATRLGCRLFLGMDPSWDVGLWESAIDASALPLVATYVGDSDAAMISNLNASLAAGWDGAVFYHWRPSALLARWSSLFHQPQSGNVSWTKLSLANDDTSQCELKWGETWCYLVPHVLQKVLNPALSERVPSAFSLLNSLRITQQHVNQLLVKFAEHGSHEQAACAWLRETPQVWTPWVHTAQNGACRATQPARHT
jgi:ABC-type proline/glycine betaine transport system substrate-binding protein